ncbi:hypothetical protein J2749_001843 [Methanobacterium oryzae]
MISAESDFSIGYKFTFISFFLKISTIFYTASKVLPVPEK